MEKKIVNLQTGAEQIIPLTADEIADINAELARRPTPDQIKDARVDMAAADPVIQTILEMTGISVAQFKANIRAKL